MKKILLIAIIFALASCEKSDLIIYHSYDTLANDNLYGAGSEGIEKGCYIYQSSADLDTLVAKMAINGGVNGLPNVDFESQTCIVAFDEVKGSGGYVVEVRDIVEYADSAIVEVYYSETGSGFSVISQPYHMVKISKVDKPFHVKVLKY